MIAGPCKGRRCPCRPTSQPACSSRPCRRSRPVTFPRKACSRPSAATRSRSGRPAPMSRTYVTQTFFGRQRVLMNAAGGIEHVLLSNAANYRRSPATIRILRPIVGRGLFLSEGEDWRLQRRTIAPALAPRVIPMLSRHIVTVGGEALTRLAAEIEPARRSARRHAAPGPGCGGPLHVLRGDEPLWRRDAAHDHRFRRQARPALSLRHAAAALDPDACAI